VYLFLHPGVGGLGRRSRGPSRYEGYRKALFSLCLRCWASRLAGLSSPLRWVFCLIVASVLRRWAVSEA
jgi:hypothetical protein